MFTFSKTGGVKSTTSIEMIHLRGLSLTYIDSEGSHVGTAPMYSVLDLELNTRFILVKGPRPPKLRRARKLMPSVF
jgi:hypothetical protein